MANLTAEKFESIARKVFNEGFEEVLVPYIDGVKQEILAEVKKIIRAEVREAIKEEGRETIQEAMSEEFTRIHDHLDSLEKILMSTVERVNHQEAELVKG